MVANIISYGAFPNDGNASSIQDAFANTQNNFNQLFNFTANAGVNYIASNTLTVSQPTGNITINNPFSSLTVQSNTLEITSLGGYANGNGVTITDSTNTLLIELSSNINANSSLNNLTLTGNLQLTTGELSLNTGNIELGNGNITLSNGTLHGNVAGVGGPGAVQFANANSITTGNSSFTYDDATQTLFVPSITTTRFNALVGAELLTSTVNANGIISVTSSTGNATVTDTLTGNIANFTGNVTAARFIGNGAGLTDVAAQGNLVTGIVANANHAVQSNTANTANVAITVSAAAQPNITSLGTLNSLEVLGNANAAGLHSTGALSAVTSDLGTASANSVTVSGNIISNNIIAISEISASRANFTANVTTGNVSTTTLTATTANVAANISAGNLNTTGQLTVSQAANIGGLLNTRSIDANGNVVITGTLSAGQTSTDSLNTAGNIVATGTITGTAANIAGGITSNTVTTGNITGTRISVTGSISGASANISGALIAGNTTVSSLNSAGEVNGTGGIFTGNLEAATLTTTTWVASPLIYAQNEFIGNGANITGNSTFTGLVDVSGNLQVTGTSTTGDIFSGNITANGSGVFSAGIACNGINAGNGTVRGGAAQFSGALSANGGASVGSLTTTGNIVAGSGNFNGNISATTVTGSQWVVGELVYAQEQFIGNGASITGNVTITGNIAATGNTITLNGNTLSLGNVSTLNIGGSPGGQVLGSLGAGNVEWRTLGTVSQVDLSSNVDTVLTGTGTWAPRAQVPSTTPPLTSNSPGTPGQMAVTNGYIYVCVSANTWQRAALTTF